MELGSTSIDATAMLVTVLQRLGRALWSKGKDLL